MRKTKVIVFLILAFGLIFFGCKSPEKEKELEPEVVEETEATVEEAEQTAEETEEVVEEAEEAEEGDEGYNVFFAPDSFVVDKLIAEKLNMLISEVKMESPNSIKIVGHSAMLDSEKEEERISLKRAVAVAEYLNNSGLLGGLEVSSVEGVGAKDPLYPHSDITTRSLNRRVEIIIEK